MRLRKISFVLTAAFALLMNSEIHAAVISQWTFETSVPVTAGPLTPEVGTGSAVSNTAGTFSNPSGNGSIESWSTNGWNLGEYFQFQAPTTGFENIIVTFDQTGSSTGPRDFQFSYSTDGTTFTDFGTAYALTGTSWSSATPDATLSTSYSFDLSSVAALNNIPNAYFRLTNTTTTSIGGATVASSGTGRVDNFTVNGVVPVPEPGTIALGTLAGLGFLGYRLRRKQS